MKRKSLGPAFALFSVVAFAACSSGSAGGGDGGGSGAGPAGAAGSGSGGASGAAGSGVAGGSGAGGNSATGGNGSGGNGSGGNGSGGAPSGGSGGSGTGGAPSGGSGGQATGGQGGASGGAGGRGTGGAAGGRGGSSGGGASGQGGASRQGGASGQGGAGAGAGGAGGAGASANITVWIAGDSTVANGSAPCPIGWGGQFMPLFNNKVTVSNRAIAGRSVQTWLYDVSSTLGTNGECDLNSTTFLADWTAMLNGMKTGDYLFIQFGINDTDSTCPRHVGTALFKTYYGMMAQAAKDRGANPVFVTPVSSISCSGSKAVPTRGTFSTATMQAGTQYDVPVIDLEQLSVALYTSLGFCPLPGPDTATTFESGAVGDFFCEDHTHFEQAGAVQIADLVAKALTDQGIGLGAYLK
jgi:lysophospholipase L1-like esterase